MKSLLVKYIETESRPEASKLFGLLDENNIEWHAADSICWEKDFPYAPDVKFRIAHCGDYILLNYKVCEKAVRAVAETDNGRVWEDSCCEFFFSPADDGVYYNIECNCAGKILFASGKTREGRMRFPLETVSKIDRWSSLGSGVFEERTVDEAWSLSLVIPACMFEGIGNLRGLSSRANFYKCGDKLTTPHFLSWNMVETSSPDFHRPEYFGKILFE